MSIAELQPAAAPGNIPTAEELVGRARALAPKLRERASRPSATATSRGSRSRNISTPA